MDPDRNNDAFLVAIAMRNNLIEILTRLDIPPDILRQRACVTRTQQGPLIELHVDFETERFDFWIAVHQHSGQLVVYRHAKQGYERQRFLWQWGQFLPDGTLDANSVLYPFAWLPGIVAGFAIDDKIAGGQ